MRRNFGRLEKFVYCGQLDTALSLRYLPVGCKSGETRPLMFGPSLSGPTLSSPAFPASLNSQ